MYNRPTEDQAVLALLMQKVQVGFQGRVNGAEKSPSQLLQLEVREVPKPRAMTEAAGKD